MDAALCAFVSLVAKLFQFRRKPHGPPGSCPAVDAQRRDHSTLQHPLRLARKSERSTSPAFGEGGKILPPSVRSTGGGGARRLRRV